MSIGHRVSDVHRTTDWDQYFLNIAMQTARRSNCVRRQHGAVIVRNRRIRSTGYNGPPSGHPHCDEGACPRARSESVSGWSYDAAPPGAVTAPTAPPGAVTAPPSAAGAIPPSAPGAASCIAIHAEANAILYSSPEQREGASIYITGVPCFGCAKLIANSGITEVVATGAAYEGWDSVRAFLLDCGVRVRQVAG